MTRNSEVRPIQHNLLTYVGSVARKLRKRPITHHYYILGGFPTFFSNDFSHMFEATFVSKHVNIGTYLSKHAKIFTSKYVHSLFNWRDPAPEIVIQIIYTTLKPKTGTDFRFRPCQSRRIRQWECPVTTENKRQIELSVEGQIKGVIS